MNYKTIDFPAVDDFVEKQQAAGSNVWWDGWTMVFFIPHSKAYSDKNGCFNGGRWGFSYRVAPNNDGEWRVPLRHVKSV